MVDIRTPASERGLVAVCATEVISGESSKQINARIHRRYMSEAAIDDPLAGGTMAAMDDSRRGVREDGAWLMRGSPPRVVEVSSDGDAFGESGCARAQSGVVASGMAADGGVELC